jgi:uncharacterized protein (UPF0212 family)
MRCPKHDLEYVPVRYGVLACPNPKCGNGTTEAAIEDKHDRQKRSSPKEKVIEKDLQRDVVTILECRDYEVMETGKTRVKVSCPNCGSQSYPTGWQGNTPGLPDLLIRGRHWPIGVWLAVELKGSETPVTDAQQALWKRGGSYILRSWETVWEVIQSREERFRNASRP